MLRVTSAVNRVVVGSSPTSLPKIRGCSSVVEFKISLLRFYLEKVLIKRVTSFEFESKGRGFESHHPRKLKNIL